MKVGESEWKQTSHISFYELKENKKDDTLVNYRFRQARFRYGRAIPYLYTKQ